jgi:hypothetical protein
VLLVHRECKGSLAHLECPAMLVAKDLVECQDQRATKETLDTWEALASLDLRDLVD